MTIDIDTRRVTLDGTRVRLTRKEFSLLRVLALHAGEASDLRSGLMVPDTIHDVVMARIDRLPDETKQLLQTAAVIGR